MGSIPFGKKLSFTSSRYIGESQNQNVSRIYIRKIGDDASTGLNIY
jgi:hypothetical protein